MTWLALDDSHLTDAERRAGDRLATIARDHDAGTVQVTELDASLQPQTTVLVVTRPTETLMLITRADGSTVIATDDVLARLWRDPEPTGYVKPVHAPRAANQRPT